MEAPLRKHIVMVPIMARGHLIPFLELARKILHQNPIFTITIVNTPLNIGYLRSIMANHPSPPPQIHLISLPFNSSDHGLPPNSENANDLSLDQIIKLFHASTTLEAPLRKFVSDLVAHEGSPPVCIISDLLMGWLNEVAKDFDTVNYTFLTAGAYGTTAFCSIYMNLPHLNTVQGGTHEQFAVPGFPESCRFSITELTQNLIDADGKNERSRFFRPQISHCFESHGWLCNTSEEIEIMGCEALRNFTKLPLWCVGPLIPSNMLEDNFGVDTGSKEKLPCIKWLDSHPRNSVLYISFGSQHTISEIQMMELAKGLEESNKPFIWVIRPPMGFDLKGGFKPHWLPSGFEDRVGNQGFMVYDWAPQIEILCHPSIGVFMSHCGWNSVMESLSQGVPLIGWPLGAEQGCNAKMLVEDMGVCVVLTTGANSMIKKEDVTKVIEMVFDENEKGKGHDMRKKASKFGNLVTTSVKGSYKVIDDFVSTILSI